ncbi:hypothetical protein CCM_08770 [Cordyceps militaris CM01]|uniref:Biotin protein ligase n=1 Tax=Cordyceps militaris (strain CM01) TaxID=983644 RepID=G3JS78_CORMM|nr:uncharacterized protein CCM_08770 [Cordyceps militaris CM01]EGX88724.1 hypothetical protein CCM_08770 [Cordyceps militaris CM01]
MKRHPQPLPGWQGRGKKKEFLQHIDPYYQLENKPIDSAPKLTGVSPSTSSTSSRRVTSLLSLALLVMTLLVGPGAAQDGRPAAFVWRGPKDDPELSHAVGELLESSARNFNVSYVWADKITPESLKTVQVFAFPGGDESKRRYIAVNKQYTAAKSNTRLSKAIHGCRKQYTAPKSNTLLSKAIHSSQHPIHCYQTQYTAHLFPTLLHLSTALFNKAPPSVGYVDDAWAELEPVAQYIRDFVAGGGRYLGFCLGAYLAADDPGLALLPPGSSVPAECDEPDAQVRHTRDTTIQVDWAFSSGEEAGTVATNRWIFYQEGNLVKDFPETDTSMVIARYSKTDDVAATINKYGEGWVGTTGPHPEANKLWYDFANLTAQDGFQFAIGHDLIEATMSGGLNVNNLAAKPRNGTSPDNGSGANNGTSPDNGGSGNNGTGSDNGGTGSDNDGSGRNGTATTTPTATPKNLAPTPKTVASSGSRRAKNPFRFFFRR